MKRAAITPHSYAPIVPLSSEVEVSGSIQNYEERLLS